MRIHLTLAPLALALVSLGVSGCTCAESHEPDDAASPDAPLPADGSPRHDAALGDTDEPARDGGGLCTTRVLRDMPIDELTLLDPIEPHAGRSFRVAVRYVQPDGCHSRAMTRVEIDEARFVVRVTVRDWVLEGAACSLLAREDTRILTLSLPSADWTIEDASAGGESALALVVGPGVRSPCTPDRDSCLQDCDCEGAQRCLYAMSPSGPWGFCAEPCEEDLDCGEPGDRCERELVGGPTSVCGPRANPCVGMSCPSGYACEGERCEPTFRLNGASRHECSCDAECDPGLVCVRGEGGARCEVPCPSGGAWCEGAHACGAPDELSVSDAVCGWLGG